MTAAILDGKTSEILTMNRLPIVVILGATGTGKSKLAVHLARKFGGEVISADSMQVYRGLDILTNKMTFEEMHSIPHHMISIVKPCETFDVTCFRNRALPILEDILSKGKIPFIVGGTNYYIESLLWEVLIRKPGIPFGIEPDDNDGDVSICSRKRKITENSDVETKETDTVWKNEILSYFFSRKGEFNEVELSLWTPLQLHTALREVDNERASRLHPNDVRKIIRSLQIRFSTGRKHSELIDEQKQGSLNSSDRNTELSDGDKTYKHLGGPLRFPNSFCLWIGTPKEILEQRIEARVDEMVGRGLKEELNSYFEELLAENRNLDFTRGLLQSIGFKEFRTYLQQALEDRDTEEGEKLFAQGLLELKLVTKRYARRQLKWINQRFLRPSRRQVPPVYGLNCSTLGATDWDEEVISVSDKILEAHLTSSGDRSILTERRIAAREKADDDLTLRTCEICSGRSFVGKYQLDIHMKSRKHHLMLKRSSTADEHPLAVL